MQVQETVWGELSRSSKDALRWAAAAARARADRAGRPLDEAEVDEFDLLVGIMLSHPSSSEPRQLLAHVGASAADVLPPDYPAPGKDLLHYGAEIPADRSPELTDTVDAAVLVAAQQPRGSADVVELRALFGGLLYASNLVATGFRELLARAGLPSVVDAYRDYLADPSSGDYAAYLTRVFPYRAAPVEIPDYKADKAAIGDDLVDIRAEVDAFAYLLASRSLKPPLAVGLFGDWGSGKTFFMESVQERIGQLVGGTETQATPQRELPFWKQIVQINFNAWHYVNGDLWASLVEHVFSELRVTRNDNDTELAKRQKHWLAQIDIARKKQSRVLGELNSKLTAREKARRRSQSARAMKEREEEALARAREKALADVRLESLDDATRESLRSLAIERTDGTAGEALDAIADLRAQLQRASGAYGAYPWDRGKTLLALGGLLAVPLLVLVLSQIGSIPAVAQVFAGLSAALAVLAGAIRSVTSWATSRLDKIAKAEAAINADIAEQQRQLDEAVEAAARRVADADAEVKRLSARAESVDREIAALEARAKTITSAEILGEFVAERVGSSDYRKLLGTAALIQRDFDELSRLIDEENARYLEEDSGGDAPPETLNRIILYIDDLDRCEPARVIEVLQAVHLLLAFRLFVVVVAVDSRWLAHSLEEHYPALTISPATGGSPTDQPSPSDYLEKIFQVPFWIEPLGESARKSLVRGLLQGNLATSGGADGSGPGGGSLTFAGDVEEMVHDMFGRNRAARMQTAALSVTPAELTFLDELAPLLGDTPRSIKRFVNVYQLLCALPPPHGVDPSAYEGTCAFLLAITDGLPGLSAALSEELRKQTDGATLADAVASARGRVIDDEMARYDEWAAQHADLVGVAVETLHEPARRVGRFSFRY